MVRPQWLLQCTLAATVVAWESNGHQPQRPLHPERLNDEPDLPALQHPPPPPPASNINVDDPRWAPLFALHRDLVNINSISGHEHAVGIYLETYLQSLNYTVERQNVDPLADKTCHHAEPTGCDQQHARRFNLLAHPPNHRRTPILLTTHIDTVPPFYPYSERPSPHPKDPPQLWGRGAVDAKACIATQLTAAQSLLTSSRIPSATISHLFVVGEEVGGDGMIAANSLNLTWDTVIFGEPTELKLAAGHKGILGFTLRARGKAAHSGYPWLGSSATSLLVRALAGLEEMAMPWSDQFGKSTLNIGTIEGGVAANVVAESASATIGIRIAAGDADAVKALVLDTVHDVDPTNLEVDFSGGEYGPVKIDHDVPGFESMTVNYGTDIPHLAGAHKRYLYGPGSILVAHSDHEHLRKRDLVEAVGGYKRIILHAVGK